MSHASRSLPRFLPPAWLALGLTFNACTQSKSDASSAPGPTTVLSTPVSAAYGEERIGYRQQTAVAQAAQAAGTPVSASAPNANAGQGSSDGLVIAEESPVFGPPVGTSSSTPAFMPTTTPPLVTAEPTTPSVTDPVDAPPIPTVVDNKPLDAGADAGLGGPPGSDAGVDGGIDAGADRIVLSEIPGFDQLPETERQPENPFRITTDMLASTFSIDADTASYSLARSNINAGVLPSRSTVRIEEFINYFHLHYGQPPVGHPFSVYSELGTCPWNTQNQLLLVGIQGEEVPLVAQPQANLVFLVDVSGSMADPKKLPLLKQGLRMMIRQLRPTDTVSLVTYASGVQVVLDGATGADQAAILNALSALQASGSTNGQGGIQTAYEVAQSHFIEGGNNRVLLATDGDFNVGLSEAEGLSQFIATKRDSNVFLSVYGFGTPGAYNDPISEGLADNGNGVYFFIDSAEEARRAFVHTLTGSLLTVAKDVKLQLQFNPEHIKGYRLIGYENRVLANTDFDNDAVDAGELGAGTSVTALIEIIPTTSDSEVPTPAPGTDPLTSVTAAPEVVAPSQVQPAPEELMPVTGSALFDVRIRYKGTDLEGSKLITQRLSGSDVWSDSPSMKFAFASGVAELAMQLRGSQYLGNHRNAELLQQLQHALPADAEGAVQEFIDLSNAAHSL